MIRSNWYSMVRGVLCFLIDSAMKGMWPDGKEMKAMVQQTTRETTAAMHMMANDVSKVMSSSAINPNPIHVFTPDFQETNGDWTFDSGSHLQILPQITLYCAGLSTRGPRTGSSEAVFSKSGSPPALYCGYMGSVRHSPSHATPISDVSFLYSGLREERYLVSRLVCYVVGNLSYLPALRSSKKS